MVGENLFYKYTQVQLSVLQVVLLLVILFGLFSFVLDQNFLLLKEYLVKECIYAYDCLMLAFFLFLASYHTTMYKFQVLPVLCNVKNDFLPTFGRDAFRKEKIILRVQKKIAFFKLFPCCLWLSECLLQQTSRY